MIVLEKDARLLEKLKSFEKLKGISDEAFAWLVEFGELWQFPEGHYVFQAKDPVDHMIMVVEGEFVIRFKRKGEWQELGKIGVGDITGVLPFSRMKEAGGFGIAIRDSVILAIHRDHFPDLVCQNYELTRVLVQEMTSRVRNFTTLRTQNEKLMALGRMSAGLAHELNNPAAAMVRSADELYQRIHSTPEKFKSVITMRITPEQTDEVNAILFSKIETLDQIEELSLMEREEAMDDIIDWLEDHDIEDGDDIADTFVDFFLTTDDLDKINEIIKGESLVSIIWWIESTLSLEKLVKEIQDASERIGTLVKSIKDYSHMDRAKDKAYIDIHEGLKSTGTMLKHKFKKKNIKVEKEVDYSLPKVKAYAGELNQVFTNLIDNAIDAMDHEGTLTIRTYRDREFVRIEISDNGAGIPEEDIHQIFEPFYTTKAMGEGTGVGLDIVQRIIARHRGSIDVESKLGVGTTFCICLPIDG